MCVCVCVLSSTSPSLDESTDFSYSLSLSLSLFLYLSRNSSQPSIAPDTSSKLYPMSAQSRRMFLLFVQYWWIHISRSKEESYK